jgi:hypothetical protein
LPRYNNNIATLPKLHCHATATSLSQRGNNLCLGINLKEMLRLEDKSFGLEDTRHKLEDRLADNPFLRLSASLYSFNNVRVTAMLEDMVDFFSYTLFISE